MIRCLVNLLLVGCFCFLGVVSPVYAQTDAPQFTQQQLRKGDKIAQKAIKAVEEGDLVLAESYWTELITDFPENPAVWSNRGNVRMGQNNFEEAIADFDQSIELAPQYPDGYLNRGIAYETQGSWDLALADYNHVLEIDPQDPLAFNNRGNAEAGQENWQQALDDYEKAVSLSPSFAVARANAALVTYQLGDRPEAIRQFRNLVRKYPMFSDVRAAMTAVLWVDGQQGEAESNWVAVVGLDDRYRNLDWVANGRRWPPKMVDALSQFLSLS